MVESLLALQITVVLGEHQHSHHHKFSQRACMNTAGCSEDPVCPFGVMHPLDELPYPGTRRLNPPDIWGQIGQILAMGRVKIK